MVVCQKKIWMYGKSGAVQIYCERKSSKQTMASKIGIRWNQQATLMREFFALHFLFWIINSILFSTNSNYVQTFLKFWFLILFLSRVYFRSIFFTTGPKYRPKNFFSLFFGRYFWLLVKNIDPLTKNHVFSVFAINEILSHFSYLKSIH